MSSVNFRGFSAVELRTCRITSPVSNKTAEISRLVKNLEIYQSLYDPTMVGTIDIDDPTGIVYDLPLLGEEFITIEFETEGSAPFEKTFLVRAPHNIERDPSVQKQHIHLEIVSMEQLRGITTIVDKGYNSHISTITEVLLKYVLKTKRPVEVEQTRGSETLVIPSWTLWKTLEFLRQRAVSANYCSPYFFFEDSIGFKFVSAEHLIETKRAAGNILTITSEPFNAGAGDGPGHVTIRNDQYLNAENFRMLAKGDTAAMINGGGISSLTSVYDVLNKRVTKFENNFKDFGEQDIKQPLASKYNASHSSFLSNLIDKPVTRYMLPLDSSNASEFMKNVGKRQMFNRHLGDTRIAFSIYGNSQLTVGDLINVVMPRVSESGNDQQLDGLYLIGRLKHSLADDQLFTHIEALRYGHDEKTFDKAQS